MTPASHEHAPRRAFALWRVALATLLIVLALPFPTTAGAANCQYVLGFKTLHDSIPATVGDCATNESHNPANGDGLQQTANGLLVWRKADNHTAFTDGFRTWVSGPFGLQMRLNTARFSWETDAAPANVDPRLSVAFQLASASQFGNLMRNLVTLGIPVRVGSLGPNVFGATTMDRATGNLSVAIDSSIVGGDPHDAAAVLIHEGTHAFNLSHGAPITTSQACLDEELTATENDLNFWSASFGPTGKPSPSNLFEQGENSELHLAESSLRAFLLQTFETYRGECGL
jgi:hypothetical protein